MGRTAKHNWKNLFLEFNRGRYKSVAEFARAEGLNPVAVRREFKKFKIAGDYQKTEQNEIKKQNKTEQKYNLEKGKKQNLHPWETLKRQFIDWPEEKLQAYLTQLNIRKAELEAIPFEEMDREEIKELGQVRRERRAILSDPDPGKKCTAHNHDGSPCRNPVERGKNVCWNHGGAPGSGCPPGTRNNLKHGLYARFIPEDPDYLEFCEEIETKSTLDILWARIKDLSFLVARSVKIAWVKDKSDQTKVLVREKSKLTSQTSESEREWELQHAWDKNNSYLTALARIEKELDAKIKLYEELLEKYEQKGLVTEKHRLRIEKLKVDIEKVKGGGPGNGDTWADLAAGDDKDGEDES